MKPFDFNNDGKVDPIEQAIAYKLVKDLEEENRKNPDFARQFNSKAGGCLLEIIATILLSIPTFTVMIVFADLFHGEKPELLDDGFGIVLFIIGIIIILGFIGFIIACIVAIFKGVSTPNSANEKDKKSKADSEEAEKKNLIQELCVDLNAVIEKCEEKADGNYIKPFEISEYTNVNQTENSVEYNVAEYEAKEDKTHSSPTTSSNSSSPHLTLKGFGAILIVISLIVGFGFDLQLFGTALLIIGVVIICNND